MVASESPARGFWILHVSGENCRWMAANLLSRQIIVQVNMVDDTHRSSMLPAGIIMPVGNVRVLYFRLHFGDSLTYT